MSELWHRLGSIAPGGSVLSVRANRLGQTWLATGGGVLAYIDNRWQALPDSVPMEQVGLVADAGKDWWAAGLMGGLVLTWDGGRSWAAPWIDQVGEPITCVAASPRYGVNDVTLLAGTGGAGILRSVDGGRRWLLSNYGLQEFTILALATAGDWSRRQVVFAGTADGTYRSSGAGRAWKPVGLKGLAVQALAARRGLPPRPASVLPAAGRLSSRPSPVTTGEGGDASGAWTILAGTEGAGLHRSQDGGFTWEPAGDELGRDVSVNALLCFEAEGDEGWLAGTDEGCIWRSTDGGTAWSLVSQTGAPVLTLAQGPDRLFAGTSDQGIWASMDAGLHWQSDPTLCAWGFRRLYRASEHDVVAIAPAGGVWLSLDDGQTWQREIEASLYDPILAYAGIPEGWIAARADGLWRRAGPGEPTQIFVGGDAPIVALALGRDEDTVWAGQADGGLWASDDGGDTWRAVDSPFQGQRLLGIGLAPEDGTPLVGTHSDQRREVALWRLADGRWQRWLSRGDTWPGMALAAAGRRGEETWTALGGKPYMHTPGGWREVQLPGGDDLVVAITNLSADGARYLIAGSEVLRWDASRAWKSLPLPPGSGAIPLDLCLTISGKLLCLDAAGVMWELKA